jgi:hypothetical protein
VNDFFHNGVPSHDNVPVVVSHCFSGHDNKYNESHPFVFERLVKCAFAAAGLNLVVSELCVRVLLLEQAQSVH